MTLCNQPVRNVLTIDRFLLAAQAESESLQKQMAEIMRIDITHADLDGEFMPSLREAARLAAIVIADLRSAELAFKGVRRG